MASQGLPFHCTLPSNSHLFLDDAFATLPTTSQRLGEVAASLNFLRGNNVQICTKLSAGLLPPSRKTACYRQPRCSFSCLPVCFQCQVKRTPLAKILFLISVIQIKFVRKRFVTNNFKFKSCQRASSVR